jgi:hypothetical protein
MPAGSIVSGGGRRERRATLMAGSILEKLG